MIVFHASIQAKVRDWFGIIQTYLSFSFFQEFMKICPLKRLLFKLLSSNLLSITGQAFAAYKYSWKIFSEGWCTSNHFPYDVMWRVNAWGNRLDHTCLPKSCLCIANSMHVSLDDLLSSFNRPGE